MGAHGVSHLLILSLPLDTAVADPGVSDLPEFGLLLPPSP